MMNTGRQTTFQWLLLFGMLVLATDHRLMADESPFRRKTKPSVQEKSDSPFRRKSDPPKSDKSSAVAPSADSASKRPSRPPKRFRHGKYVEMISPDDDWTYKPQSLTEFDMTPRRVDMSDIDFHERIKQFGVNRAGTFAAFTAQEINGNTKIKVMDLNEGEVVTSIVTPKEPLVLDVDEGGKRLAVVSDKFGRGEKRQIGTFLTGEDVLTEESMFAPFPDLNAFKANVAAAKFVGNHFLAAVSSSGRVSVWNLEKLREDSGFDLNNNVKIACGPDPNIIAFVDDEKYGLFDVSQRKFLGVAHLPEGLKTPTIAISPSGTRLVVAGVGKAVVIDATNGQTQEEIPLTDRFGTTIEFATDDYLLVSGRSLYSISDRMLLWNYTGASKSCSVGGKTFFLKEGSTGKGTVIPVSLPDAQARKALTTVHAKPELFVLRPGDSVQIDVTKVKAQYRDEVRNALAEALTERDMKVADESDVVLAASITGPEKKVVEYGRFPIGRGGTGYVITEYVSSLEILWQGQVAWSRERTNAPGSVSAKRGQSLQDALREKTSEPNLDAFERAGFPPYVRKPNGKSVRSMQALGSADVNELHGW